MCNRIIEDPSSTARLECSLKCDSVFDDCGGFGSTCYDSSEWVNSVGYGCDVYESFGDPGCPFLGDCCPNENNITANDACCHCGGGEVECNACFNTTDKGCTNDVEWTAIVRNETISCDWFEENDMPGCANTYVTFLSMDNVSDPRETCCYCSEYDCQDVYGWHDVRRDDFGWGHGCDWYRKWDEPGCPNYGDRWPDNDGITAREACCHCQEYDPASTPAPACYDYNGWVDVDKRGCHWYEYIDEPDCPKRGHLYPNENNITAKDACCYCGGGSMNIPSASPSHQYQPSATPSVTPTYKSSRQYEPTVTPSVTPSDKPSHQYEPTIIPTETPTCYDYIGWADLRENGCDWYVENDYSGCPTVGGWYPNKNGIFANAACCYCGGGFAPYNDDDIREVCDGNDVSWENIASTKYLPGNHQGCNELEYYISIINNQTYKDENPGWTQFYCNDLNNGTMFMKDACCICNPDENIDVKNDDTDLSCIDIQIPRPWPQRNCEWFARNTSRCYEFGASEVLIKGDNNTANRYANEVCCVCGGGTRECHEFNDHWMDSHPDEPFNCDQYDSEERCAADGSGLISLGHNANTQCCVCGGGYTFKNDNVIVPATNKTCLDERNWQSNDLTCFAFVDAFGVPDVEQCLQYGHITSTHGTYGVNASKGCCDCWYGYDADTGGGYKGMLLGKMLRVGMMNYTDLEYVHNVSDSGNVEENSTLYEFVINASESYGFGLILYDMNKFNIDHANDKYYACLNGELVNFSSHISCVLKNKFLIH